MPHHNILIVDDDEYVLKALARQLERRYAPILTAHDAAEGLVKLACFDISLVISDHVMPDMKGLDFLKVVRQRHPEVVRMMITGHADLETAIDAINGGEIFRFLVKPWEQQVLLDTVAMALARIDRAREQARMLATVRRRSGLKDELERRFPGITTVERDPDGAVVLG